MTFTGTLLPYQVEDVQVMQDLKTVLVAYGQGTGKTVMTIACLENLFDAEEILEPGLVVCLAGLKYQWQKAIARFTCDSCEGKVGDEGLVENGGDHEHTPTSTSIVIDGTPKQRASQYARAWEYDYIILGYEQVANEWGTVKNLPRGFVVCDEVSMIKGFRAQRSKAVKKLDAQYKYGLTGTPMENGRPEEIFSIFEWIEKRLFGRFDLFDKTFIVREDSGRVARYRNIPTFRTRLAERMVRRTPKDPEVSPYMPTEDHKDPFLVPLDRASRKVYNIIADELLVDLVQALSSNQAFSLAGHYGWGSQSDQADRLRGMITSKMLALQMLCNHPETLRLSAQRYLESQVTGKQEGSAYAADLASRGLLEALTACPKMTATVALVKGLLEQDPRNKVVLFTTYTDMVALFVEAFGDVAVPFTGKQNAKQKEINKVRFQTEPDVRVLVSSDAGGYGVDLPQANWLLNYDQPDKAGLADQRDTRIVRASSEFGIVSIQSVLAKNTLEVRRHQALNQKRLVAAAFIDGERINRGGGVDLDLDTVTAFLNKTRP
jgi:SNF2 family DNA or RNA helicase